MDIISHISEGFKAHKPASPEARSLMPVLPVGLGAALHPPPPSEARRYFKTRLSPSFSSEEWKPFPACLPRTVSPFPGPDFFSGIPAPLLLGQGLGVSSVPTPGTPGALTFPDLGRWSQLPAPSLSQGPRAGWADCQAQLPPGPGTGLMATGKPL